MTTHEPITNKTWPMGSSLPTLEASCPRCGTPLRHYVNYSQSFYVVACFKKIDEIKQIFCAYNVRRPISIVGKKKEKEVSDIFEPSTKMKSVKPKQWKRGFKSL